MAGNLKITVNGKACPVTFYTRVATAAIELLLFTGCQLSEELNHADDGSRWGSPVLRAVK